MIKMIIVEDEPLMNEYLVNCLEWQKLAIDLCGVFYNGKAALEFLTENEVDIVVTDIQMPQMDGLTMISKIAEKRPETKFIVLSNFDDFYMVKNAFKYGATDYILKTDFDPVVFQKMLMDIIQKSLSSQPMDKSSIAMREYSLKQFFWSDTPNTNVLKKMRIDIDAPMRVAVLKFLNYEDVLKTQWNTEKELMKFGLSNFIEEILESHCDSNFFFNSYDEIIFLFSGAAEQDFSASAEGIFDNIFEVLSTNFEITATAGLCDTAKLPALKEQYHIANQSLAYSFIFGCNRLISCNEILQYTETTDLKALSARIEGLLSNLDFKGLCTVLEEFAKGKPAYIFIPSIREIYKNLIKKLLETHTIYEIPLTHEGLLELNVDLSCVSELNQTLAAVCQYLSGQLSYSDIAMIQIQNYIRKNYSENITLQFLAKQFLFDYTELSRRFQKATGMTFSKFLNDIRLTEAMKLIRTTDFKCSQISVMVGYNNYESFSRAFKDKFQKAPNEVRKVNKL